MPSLSILGAGLSGLICGALNAQSQIYERNPSSFVGHRAVLRFRDDKIARALGLTFRKVTVRKEIWYNGLERRPSVRFANLYSQKVRGIIADSSIWNLAPAERYIAPDDLHSVLADICGKRVHWNTEIDGPTINQMGEIGPIISTIPLPVLIPLLGLSTGIGFARAPIIVNRFRVPSCDVFQTVYFPSPALATYRATLTGDLLTVESLRPLVRFERLIVHEALGLTGECDTAGEEVQHKQEYGKIIPIPDGVRKALLHRITQEFGIYMLGRFATWRNILLDDVFDDIAAIRRMMTQTQYDITLERSKP